MKTLVCYGDSNTHGTEPIRVLGQGGRHPTGQRWPDEAARLLGPDWHVISEGLPGRTTVHDDPVEGGSRNGYSVLPAILHSHKPIDVLTILLGTNDLKPRFSVTAWEIARSVERLVLLARAEGVARDIVVIAPPPVRETGVLADVFAGAEARQVGLADHLKRIAAAQGCGFVDAGAHVQVSDVDGVHWSPDAHLALGAVIAHQVARA